jgi:hypothetical protein
MRWRNLRGLFGIPDDPVIDDVKGIEPRPLNARELDLISDILRVNVEWKDADLSMTKVIAEGTCGINGTSWCAILRAPVPENPQAKSERESVGQISINIKGGGAIIVQLSQSGGRLEELYLFFVDSKDPKRKLPTDWVEISREAANL